VKPTAFALAMACFAALDCGAAAAVAGPVPAEAPVADVEDGPPCARGTVLVAGDAEGAWRAGDEAAARLEAGDARLFLEADDDAEEEAVAPVAACLLVDAEPDLLVPEPDAAPADASCARDALDFFLLAGIA